MAMHYKESTMFIKKLKYYKLTKQQKKTLKEQVLAGDLSGAKTGLRRLKKGGATWIFKKYQ